MENKKIFFVLEKFLFSSLAQLFTFLVFCILSFLKGLGVKQHFKKEKIFPHFYKKII